MKILLFSTGFIDVMIELANALSELETTVLMLPKNALTKERLKIISKGIILEEFYMPRQRYPTSLFMMGRIVKTIFKHNPDLIHIQAHGHGWFFAGFPFLKKYPIVNTIHDPEVHLGDRTARGDSFSAFFGRIFSNHYITHGTKVKKDLMKLYDLPESKISVVPYGGLPSLQKLYTKKNPREPNTILFFGRIWKYKGLDYLIRAEPLIRQKIGDIKIIIAGRGEDFSKYEKIMINKSSYDIRNYKIPLEEMCELFQKASVVVLPYLEATQSGVIPIAYNFGKPVIVTDVGSIREVVENGKEGFVIPPRDVKALAVAIVKILSDDGLRENMGRNAYQKINTELSWGTIAKQTLGAYKLAMGYEKNLKNPQSHRGEVK